MTRILLSLLLALTCYAPTPLFFAQNGAMTAAFSPADVSGLKLWLVAGDVSGADGDTVQTWSARTPTTINATQSTLASRPTLQLSEIKGQSAILSDGVNDFMTLSASIVTTGSWTVITVQKRLSSGGLGGSLGNNVGVVPPFAALEYGSLSRMYIASRTDQKYSTIPSHAYHVITSQDNAGTLVMRVDGVNQSLTAAATTGSSNFERMFSRLGEYWGTYIAEILAWERALNSTELGQIETYLLGKYF
jgi:hypothetical protein